MNIYILEQTGKIAQSVEDHFDYTLIKDDVIAFNQLRSCGAAVVLLDYGLRQQQTAEFIRLLLSYNAELTLIVIGNGLCEQDIIPCLLAGSKGYQEIDGLQRCVKKMMTVTQAGEAWVSRRLVGQLIAYVSQHSMHSEAKCSEP